MHYFAVESCTSYQLSLHANAAAGIVPWHLQSAPSWQPEANHLLSGDASLAFNTVSDLQGCPMLQQTAAGLLDPLPSIASLSSLEELNLDSMAAHCLDGARVGSNSAQDFAPTQPEQSLMETQSSTLLNFKLLPNNFDQEVHGNLNPFPESCQPIQLHKCTGELTQQQLDC